MRIIHSQLRIEFLQVMNGLVRTLDIEALHRDFESILIFKFLYLIKLSVPSCGFSILSLKWFIPRFFISVFAPCLFVFHGWIYWCGWLILEPENFLLIIRGLVADNENERHRLTSIRRAVNFLVSMQESNFHCLICRDVCTPWSWFFIYKVLKSLFFIWTNPWWHL